VWVVVCSSCLITVAYKIFYFECAKSGMRSQFGPWIAFTYEQSPITIT
jgi:hypothetical protein